MVQSCLCIQHLQSWELKCKIVSVSHIWCTLQSSIPIGQLLLEGQVVQNCRSQNWKKRNPDQRKKIGEFSNQVLYSFIVRFAFWVILTGIFMHFQLNFFSLILRGFCLIIRKQIWSHNFDGVQLDHQHSASPCLTTHDSCHLPLCTDPVKKKNVYIYLYTFIFVMCILQTLIQKHECWVNFTTYYVNDCICKC